MHHGGEQLGVQVVGQSHFVLGHVDAQLGDVSVTGGPALLVLGHDDGGLLQHGLIHQGLLLLPEVLHALAVQGAVLLGDGADALEHPEGAGGIVGVAVHLVGGGGVGDAGEEGNEHGVLGVAQGQPVNGGAVGGPVGEGLENMDLGGPLGADDPVVGLAGQGHVQRGTLIAAAVDVHNGEDVYLLIGAVEQRVEGVGVVLAHLGGSQDLHAHPVAHVVVVLAGVVGDALGQMVEVALLHRQSQLIDERKQAVGVDVAVLGGGLGVHQADHVLVAEDRHLVVGHLHGAVVMAAVDLHDPGFGLVGDHDGVALFGAVLVHVAQQHVHGLPGAGGHGGHGGGQNGLTQAGFHEGIGLLPGFAGGGGHGGGNAHAVLIGAGAGVHAVVAPGVVRHIGVLIGGGRQRDLEPGGGVLDVAAGHVLHPGLHHEHLVVVALALILAARDDIGPLIADVLAHVDAGTGQRTGAQQQSARQRRGQDAKGLFHSRTHLLIK